MKQGDEGNVDETATIGSAREKRPRHTVQQSDMVPTGRPPHTVLASVAARLLKLAHECGEEYQLVLMRYGLERLLYRLGRSSYAGQFVVKGALLFTVWAAQAERDAIDYKPRFDTASARAPRIQCTRRATHDLDLLGFGSPELARLEQVFRDLSQLSIDEDDGLAFQPETVRAAPIREDQEYGGVRVHLLTLLGKARIPLQVDVGFGDVVTPAPTEVAFPTLLPSLPAPHVRVYPRETVVAEKFEALVRLGPPNTRMKDFYDLWMLANQFEFEGDRLCAAFRATFARRRTSLPQPEEKPIALTSRFGDDAIKRAQWAAFLRKGHLTADAKPGLSDILAMLGMFLLPPSEAATRGRLFRSTWPSGGPWRTAQ